MDDVSMIGVGVSSAGSWGLFWSVTVATELVMLGVSVKDKSFYWLEKFTCNNQNALFILAME